MNIPTWAAKIICFISGVVVVIGVIYTVSQINVPPMACYNFDTDEQILIFFGTSVTDKVGNQKML